MKIHDISQEIFNCQIYPGDPIPEKKTLCSMENGDLYNLTAFSMCAHNGTLFDNHESGNTINLSKRLWLEKRLKIPRVLKK